MAGPSLALGVNAKGQETLVGLNEQLSRLRENLTALKGAGKADLSGLSSAAAEIKKFRADFADSNAGLRTSFAELAEAIKGGFSKASIESEAGAKKLKTTKAKEIAEAQALYEKSLAQQVKFTNEELGLIKAGGVQLAAAHAESLRLQSAVSKDQIRGGAAIGVFSNPKPTTGKDTEIEAAWAAHTKATADTVAASKVSAWARADSSANTEIEKAHKEGFRGFAAIEKAAAKERSDARKENAKAEALVVKDYDAMVAKSITAEKQKAALLRRDQELDAAFAASNERGRARVLVGARAQLDQGLPAARVQQNFGPQATGLAQAASSLKSLQAELGTAPTKIKIATSALNDLHSAARGVASGFGAMFLTWGNIAPLLAGAALSNAFVQTVKLGSSVGQTLSTIKELGGNTVGEVAKVKTSLLELSAQGPFGPLEVAEAFKTLSLAGLTAQQQVAAIKDVLNFAVAGDLPITKAAEGLVTISTAFGYSAENYGRVADVVAKAAATSIASVEGMTAAFGTAAALNSQYGVTLEDLALQLALVNNAGTRNQAAGTAVKNFYSTLLSDAPKVKKALQDLSFSPRIETGPLKGQVKGAIQLINELRDALAKKSPEGRQAAIDAITNERGNKNAAAVLGQTREQLEALKKQLDEAYGFSAIAASYMSLTAANQIKGVFSALQSSLVSSFDAIEPSVLQVANTLKIAFNSDEFKSTIQGLASSVANFSVFLVEHAKTIGYVIAGYVAFKGALVAVSVATAAAAGITTLTAAWKALTAATVSTALVFPVISAEMGISTAATTVNTAATAANTLMQRASAAGATLQAAAVRVLAGSFAFLRLAMGPIAFILGGIATAWLLYKSTTAEANVTTADAATLIGTELVASLNKEADRLAARNKLIREGTDARAADIVVQQMQAKAELSSQQVKGEQPLRAAVDKANANYLSTIGPQYSTGIGAEGEEISVRTLATDKQRVAAYQELIAKQKALSDYQKDQEKIRSDVDAGQSRLREESRVAEEARAAKAKADGIKFGTEPFGKPKADTTAFTGARREFADEEALIAKQYGNQQKLLDLKNKNKLISDEAYAYQSEQIADAMYKAETAALQRYITESEALIAAERGKGKEGKASAEESRLRALAEGYKEQLSFSKAQAGIKKQGSGEKADDSFDKEIAKMDAAVTLAKEQQQVAQDSANLTERQQAYRTAENTLLASTNEFLREKNRLIAQATAELALASDASRGPVDDVFVARLQKSLDEKTAQVNSFITARNKDAAALGQIAADNAQPNWQKMLEGFKNVVQQMESAYNEVVEGFVTKGQDIFAEVVKNGKFSLKSLLDVIENALIKQVYQTQIAPLFADMGKLVAEKFFPQGGKNPNYGNEGNNYKIGGVDTAATNTTTAFTTLQTTGITPATSALAQLVSAANSAAAALFRAGGSGGGGGSLASLFTGSSGSGSGGSAGGADTYTPAPETYAAKGNVFGFAKGGAFTNSVVTGRTPFHFKNGGKFSRGEMGEAGPEAIMPLKRGDNGALGVAMVGGGGGNSTTVEVHNYGEGKARTQETKNPDGSKVIRVIIDQAKREVAGDIQRGGQIGDAVETQYGMNRANGLPRR